MFSRLSSRTSSSKASAFRRSNDARAPTPCARASGLSRRLGLSVTVALASLLTLAFAGSAAAATAPGLGSAGSFAVLGGSAVTNTGPSVIYGDLGSSPTPAISGFPPGIVNGVIHAGDPEALAAQTARTTAYNNLAGQAADVSVTTDLGGQSLTPGVYNSASSQGLTGPLTLNAQGNPNAVFIFQIGSDLTTGSSASVNLINGAQACNVFWQVGSSATLGTSTAFVGNILASASITATTGATVHGRLLAGTGAVTLDTNVVTRSTCATSTGTGGGGGTATGGTTTGPTTGTTQTGGRPDRSGPIVRIRIPRVGGRNPTAGIRVRDRSGVRSVAVYIDGRRVRRTSRRSFSVRLRRLRVGRHRITVVARDRAGNRSVTRRSFVVRRTQTRPAPRFTG